MKLFRGQPGKMLKNSTIVEHRLKSVKVDTIWLFRGDLGRLIPAPDLPLRVCFISMRAPAVSVPSAARRAGGRAGVWRQIYRSSSAEGQIYRAVIDGGAGVGGGSVVHHRRY